MEHKSTSLIQRIVQTHEVNAYSKTKPAINNIKEYIIKVSQSNIKFIKSVFNIDLVQQRQIKIQKKEN